MKQLVFFSRPVTRGQTCGPYTTPVASPFRGIPHVHLVGQNEEFSPGLGKLENVWKANHFQNKPD